VMIQCWHCSWFSEEPEATVGWHYRNECRVLSCRNRTVLWWRQADLAPPLQTGSVGVPFESATCLRSLRLQQHEKFSPTSATPALGRPAESGRAQPLNLPWFQVWCQGKMRNIHQPGNHQLDILTDRPQELPAMGEHAEREPCLQHLLLPTLVVWTHYDESL
jgi:hypothetical protein